MQIIQSLKLNIFVGERVTVPSIPDFNTLLEWVHSYSLEITHFELISLISKNKSYFEILSWFLPAQAGEFAGI